ncbi:hypothetical protein VTK56DRAFT_3283 [Thermocarpiscus australiensis]
MEHTIWLDPNRTGRKQCVRDGSDSSISSVYAGVAPYDQNLNDCPTPIPLACRRLAHRHRVHLPRPFPHPPRSLGKLKLSPSGPNAEHLATYLGGVYATRPRRRSERKLRELLISSPLELADLGTGRPDNKFVKYVAIDDVVYEPDDMCFDPSLISLLSALPPGNWNEGHISRRSYFTRRCNRNASFYCRFPKPTPPGITTIWRAIQIDHL